MITQEQRKERLRELGDEFLEVYGSLELTDYLLSVSRKHDISDRHAFADIVGDALLGLIEREEIPKTLITELGVEESKAAKIQEAVAPLYEVADEKKGLLGLKEMLRIHAPAATEQMGTSTTSQVPQTQMNIKGSSVPGNLPTGEEEQKNVSGVGDGASPEPTAAPAPIPSYKKPLTDIPRYDQSDDPYRELPNGEDEGAR